eukprot:8276669-Alexandrium_andersonii.AAC.1
MRPWVKVPATMSDEWQLAKPKKPRPQKPPQAPAANGLRKGEWRRGECHTWHWNPQCRACRA